MRAVRARVEEMSKRGSVPDFIARQALALARLALPSHRNLTGNGAGAALLNAINDRFSGAQPSSARLKTFSFTQLPAERGRLELLVPGLCADQPLRRQRPRCHRARRKRPL